MNVFSPELLSIETIWDGSPHAAFTDLARYRGQWMCAFREGRAHALCCGKVRVLVSDDGKSWESAALLALRGVDLRDPKFAPGPGVALDLVMGGTRVRNGRSEGRAPLVARSKDGISWTDPLRVAEEGDWIWRVERHKGKSWGITYRLPAPRRWTVHLLESHDNIEWHERTRLRVPGLPNEATLRFRGDEAVALVRREAGNGAAWIGTSDAPYLEWRWKPTKERVGGPNFIALGDGSLVAATRLWKDRKPLVAVCAMTESSLVPILELPSGGDCGYPGMVMHRGVLWVSYYSSHEGKSKIYLAKIRLRRTRSR
jgi:hypothetical protein